MCCLCRGFHARVAAIEVKGFVPVGRGISFHLGRIPASLMILRNTSEGTWASFKISANRKSYRPLVTTKRKQTSGQPHV